MSLPILTADELLSEAKRKQGACWRIIESQYIVSTLKLTNGDVDKQTRLDEMIDDIKPSYPPECEEFDYVIKGAFRYPPYSNKDSRFRRRGQQRGAFYAAAKIETAVAEAAFHHALFYVESPETDPPSDHSEHTGYRIDYRAEKAINLNEGNLKKYEHYWQSEEDYKVCQNLADTAYDAKIEVILNQSIRCPDNGMTITIINPKAIKSKAPDRKKLQTWKFLINREKVVALRDMPRRTLEFNFTDWINDTRFESYINYNAS